MSLKENHSKRVVISFLLIFMIFNVIYIHFFSEVSALINNESKISMRASTDRSEYTKEQTIRLFTYFPTNNTEIRKLIVEDYSPDGKLLQNLSQLTNRAYNNFSIIPNVIGTHQLLITGLYNEGKETSILHFDIVDSYMTNTAKFMYLAVGFSAALVLLICFSKGIGMKEEILRFVFLSGIVLSVLLSLLFTDIEFGYNSPVGLIKISQPNQDDGGWVINVGGIESPPGSHIFIGGLQIPIYVIIFGLLGGYIRYLYKTSRLFLDDKTKEENQKIRLNLREDNSILGEKNELQTTRMVIFLQSLKDISLFVLSPLLAVAVWFLFSQWEPISDSSRVLAVFSFATGLVTTEIIDTLTNFTKSNLNKRTQE